MRSSAAIGCGAQNPVVANGLRQPLVNFFCYAFQGSPLWRLGMGTTMDSAAFHELVAQIRGTAASLAEAQQKVAAFKGELAQQAQVNHNFAQRRAIMLIPKRVG